MLAVDRQYLNACGAGGIGDEGSARDERFLIGECQSFMGGYGGESRAKARYADDSV